MQTSRLVCVCVGGLSEQLRQYVVTNDRSLNYFPADANIFSIPRSSLAKMGNTPTRTLTDALRATPASPTSKCAFDMKICSACTLELPKQRFNNKQWPLELNQRRCTTCIADERVAELTTPECWICFQDEVDKSECLRRDCSCRGPDAGFVHLSCLVRYSEKKNIEWDGRDPDDRLFNDFVKPWEVCPNCRQRYQNTLKADIANEFVSFVERKHPNDQQK
jgi:hypothetical protein